MQAHRQGSGSSIPDLDMVDPVLCQQDLESVPSEVDVVDRRSVPASPTDDILDVSSAGPNQTAPAQLTSEVLLDAEPSNLMGASYQEDGIFVDHSEAVLEMPGKLVTDLIFSVPNALFGILVFSTFIFLVLLHTRRLLVGQRVERVKFILH